MTEQEQFELLIDGNQFRLLKSKSATLEEQIAVLKAENSDMKIMILTLTQKINQLQKKNKNLMLKIRNLSESGLNLGYKLLEQEKVNEQLKISIFEKEISFGQQQKLLLIQMKKLENDHEALIQKNKKITKQLSNYQTNAQNKGESDIMKEIEQAVKKKDKQIEELRAILKEQTVCNLQEIKNKDDQIKQLENKNKAITLQFEDLIEINGQLKISIAGYKQKLDEKKADDNSQKYLQNIITKYINSLVVNLRQNKELNEKQRNQLIKYEQNFLKQYVDQTFDNECKFFEMMNQLRQKEQMGKNKK